MAKPLKIVLIVVGAFLALLVGGALAAALLFDPNDYKDQITAQVKEQTGRELELGHLDLDVFPWLAVGAENVKLANAEGFGTEPFAEVGEARVGVKLLPLLLDRKVEINSLTLKGLRLRPAVAKDGSNNWSDLAKPDEQKPEPEAEGASSFKLEDLDIGGIEVEDGLVHYSDAQTGKSYHIEKLNLKTGTVHVGEPIDLEASVSLAATAPAAAADIAFKGLVDWDLQAQRYGVRDLVLTLKGRGEKLLKGEDATLEAELTGALAAELGKQAAFKDLKLNFNGGNAQMQIKGDYSGDFTYDLANQVLSLPALKLAATADGKAMPLGKQDISLTGGVHYDQKNGEAQLNKINLSAAGLKISTDLKGGGLNTETPSMAGPFTIAPFSPRELLTKFGSPVQTTDPNVLKDMSLTAQYKGGFKSATLSDVVLKLDQTTARGRIDVRDFATQAVQFALNVDSFDADRYLSPATAAKTDPPTKKTEGGSVNDVQLPAEALGNLNAEGTLDVGMLKIKGIKISNAQVKLSGTKGRVHTQNITAKLYGGSVSFNHQFTPGPKPGYALKTSLSALNASPFVQDLMGKDMVGGVGTLNLDVNGNGLTVGDLRKALDGDLGVKLENGALKGFNLGKVIRKAKATLAGQAAPSENEPEKTDFSTLSFTAQIVNGILKSDSLNAASPLFRLAGSGEINLVDETINYLAKPTIVESSKGEGGKGLEDLRGIMIPIKLTGSLWSPSYKLDLQTALKQKALDKVNEKVETKKDELKQKLGDKLNKWLTPRQKPAEPAPAQPSGG